MNTAIVIKSYPADYQWLAYCLRSIQKFCTGFSEIVVILPRSHPLPLTAEKVVLVDMEETYLTQQVCKLNADRHTSADFILHTDSDTIFTKPVTPESFMRDGKARVLMTPWEDCPDAKKAWFHVMAKLFLDASTHDFMRNGTIMYPRFAYAKFRDFVEKQTGHPMAAYVANQPGREFSEYNTLGFFLWKYYRNDISWHDTRNGIPESPVRQFWSYGGLTPEIRAEIEAILA